MCEGEKRGKKCAGGGREHNVRAHRRHSGGSNNENDLQDVNFDVTRLCNASLPFSHSRVIKFILNQRLESPEITSLADGEGETLCVTINKRNTLLIPDLI